MRASTAGMAATAHIAFVESRDSFVAEQLDEWHYPTAKFVLDGPLPVPAALGQGRVVSLTAPGKLAVHGHTQPVQAAIMVANRADGLWLAGSSQIDMTDFGVPPIDIPFSKVQPALTVEFELHYLRTT
jgi:polyisoprenoid-binding protein YceI